MWCCRVCVDPQPLLDIKPRATLRTDGAKCLSTMASEARPTASEQESGPYWYYERCPLHTECSHENWKKWKVWGWSEMDAQDQLFNHLTQSGKHNCSPRLADKLVAESKLVLADEATRPLEQRGPIGAPTTPPEPRPSKRLRSLPPAPVAPVGGSSSSGSASGVVARLDHSMPPLNEPTVTLRMQEFNTIIDSVQRSSQAAKQAARVAGAASSAFTNESRILDDIAVSMQAMKAAAEAGTK